MADLNAKLNREQAQQELFELLRIPSVSSDSTRKAEMGRTAEALRAKLDKLGFSARIEQTPGHPIVYAEHLKAPGKPTVLVYGHYDVQPEDPIGEWISPPFEPEVRDGRIYARGATDDKGQAYAHVLAAELLLNNGGLPVNMKFILEGEEEIGSPSLEPFIEANKELLKSDVIVISDGSRFAKDVPTVTYGLRGLAYIEIHVQGANRDLHSGSYGGAAPNPINALCEIIAKLKDDKGRITVPGFYDSVIPLTQEERDMWAKLPHTDEAFADAIGVDALPGEEGYSVLERIWGRPTLDCNGIWGGFQGEGAKTVIAAKAGAKLSCRLVPGQDPAQVTKALMDYIPTLAPKGVKVEVIDHHGGQPVKFDLDSPYIKAADRALERVYGKSAAFGRTGGSIPIVADFARVLGAPVLLVDLGLNEDGLHSPNESFAQEDFFNGILTSAYLMEEIGK